MRSVDKGIAPSVYMNYRDALPDLQSRIGLYCSYCEMEISNEPDVEHVHPKARGGNPTEWRNLLLGCKKCNKIKKDKNPNRDNHLWPDEDNTSVAFEYYNEIMVRPAATLPAPIMLMAQNTLQLCGIDRVPGKIARPTKIDQRDQRWQKRRIVWLYAERALSNWQNNPTIELKETIGDLAKASGFYSIWVQFFANEPEMLAEIKSRFPNTYEPQYFANGDLRVRPGGRF